MDTAPSLFTQQGTVSYASAALDQGEKSVSNETEEELRALGEQMRREEEALKELRVSRGRKREIPTPSGSDDELAGPSKRNMASATLPENEETPANEDTQDPEETADTASPANSASPDASAPPKPPPPPPRPLDFAIL